MKSIIQFRVTKGEEKFVAECLDLPIVTEAKSLDELSQKIEEALALHLEGEDLVELGFSKHSSVLISFELPQKIHA